MQALQASNFQAMLDKLMKETNARFETMQNEMAGLKAKVVCSVLASMKLYAV
jgi:NifU-like protein involved in Fe-S cluster formation